MAGVVVLSLTFLMLSGGSFGLLAWLFAPQKRNVILLISDGFGPASEAFARQYYQWSNGLTPKDVLPLDTILVGSSRTRSSSSLVTDSAAGATAFACGIKSYNGAIAVDDDFKPCGTVLEAAKARGYHTGLVATSRITHATPASFAAHVPHRDMEDLIAVHEIGDYALGRTVDLMFGGGLCHFVPNNTVGSCRLDEIDVLAKGQTYGWTTMKSRVEFDQLQASEAKLPLMGLFALDHMSYEIDRNPKEEPSLAEMAAKALELLTHAATGKASERGFFLMIEGSRIDMAAHSNDAAAHYHDIMAYQDTVALVKKYVEEHPDTIMISVSDHETGGFSVAYQVSEDYPEYLWHPEIIAGIQNSTAIVSEAIVAHPASSASRKSFVLDTVLSSWMNVTDATDAEVQKLVESESSYELEMFLAKIVNIRAQLGWATHGHSAVDVNLYAYGGGCHTLAGNNENTDIGDYIAYYLDLDLESVTRKLNAPDANLWPANLPVTRKKAAHSQNRTPSRRSQNKRFEPVHFHEGML
ncbi:alkaline phosphatase [Cladochytrium replicatum]|nr:alkaline phosphatase [Cladochytrium replicatum]